MQKHRKSADQLKKYVDGIISEMTSGLSYPGDDIITSTHTLRKGLKRVRALVKLIRHTKPADLYISTNRQLRDWGRIFSDLRDAHVRSMVINQLSELAEFQSLHSELNRLIELNHKETEVLEKSLLHQNSTFSRLKKEIEKNGNFKEYFSSDELNAHDLDRGLKNSFNKSYEIFCIVQKHNVPEDLHEWRKRLKDVQYQLEFKDLVRGDKPDSGTELSAEINDHLGVDQDYFNLMIWLMYHDKKFSSSENYSTCMDLIKTMRSEQQKSAFSKAALLYRGKS